jgi:hypothetical protein
VEHGLAPLVAHLDALADNSDGPRDIITETSRKTRGRHLSTLSERSLALIEEFYADDFARFGYDADAPLPLAETKATGFLKSLRRAG